MDADDAHRHTYIHSLFYRHTHIRAELFYSHTHIPAELLLRASRTHIHGCSPDCTCTDTRQIARARALNRMSSISELHGMVDGLQGKRRHLPDCTRTSSEPHGERLRAARQWSTDQIGRDGACRTSQARALNRMASISELHNHNTRMHRILVQQQPGRGQGGEGFIPHNIAGGSRGRWHGWR